MQYALALFILSIPFLASPALAKDKRAPRLTTSLAITMPIVLESGEGLPLANTVGVGVLVPFKGGAWLTEVGVTTGFDAFRTSPQLIIGPTFLVKGRFLLGGSVLYQYVPAAGENPDAHVMGGSITPAFKVMDNLTLVIPVGVGYNTTAGKVVGVLGFKLSFSFELKPKR